VLKASVFGVVVAKTTGAIASASDAQAAVVDGKQRQKVQDEAQVAMCIRAR
jgi:hypothetical protein